MEEGGHFMVGWWGGLYGGAEFEINWKLMSKIEHTWPLCNCALWKLSVGGWDDKTSQGSSLDIINHKRRISHWIWTQLVVLSKGCHLCQQSLCGLRGCKGGWWTIHHTGLGMEQYGYFELMVRYWKEEAILVYELRMLLSVNYKTQLRVSLTKKTDFSCITQNLEVGTGALVQWLNIFSRSTGRSSFMS